MTRDTAGLNATTAIDPCNRASGRRRTLAGYEVMAMVRKRQVKRIGGHDMWARTTFVAGLFKVAA
jgi:hypothetical protein